jgi:hypothetical protein
VAKNIAKRGTQGHQMFSRALEELKPIVVPAHSKRTLRSRLARHGFTRWWAHERIDAVDAVWNAPEGRSSGVGPNVYNMLRNSKTEA